jgi:anion-transporting  ArsA/GET3 family ATPase
MKPVWEGRKVVTCVGTGGVGKTTVAAGIGVAAASRGVHTLVMTIDPARRLANALGIDDLGNVEREIPGDRLAPFGVELRAPLWVMMPDVKRTFDSLIERTAPDDERRQKILRNPIYQHLSTALAGSHEFAAVEKLYEVYAEGRYDLIVLDTPPSQNAVDFLDAPGRILDFLENETLQWLLRPSALSSRLSLRLFDFGSTLVQSTLGRLAGGETLRALTDFILSFQGMYEGFRQRSRQVRRLLRSEEMAFALVTGPTPAQHRTMSQFRRELLGEGIKVRSVFVNRLRPPPPRPAVAAALPDLFARTLVGLPPPAAAAMQSAAAEELELATIDWRAVAELRLRLGDTPLWLLPELPADVHDLRGLAELCPYLYDSTRLVPRPAPAAPSPAGS